MNNKYDTIVIGVGGMGSAALYHLARRGLRVLGIERYDIPNDMGSSGGTTRMIRLSYHEHPSYVPLVRRAYELWQQLENGFGERLLVTTGSIRAGVEDSPMFVGSKLACDTHRGEPAISGVPTSRRYPGDIPGRRRIPELGAVHRCPRIRRAGVGSPGPWPRARS